MLMKKIFLFEPSIGSDNIGDQIIVDSIKREMGQLFNPAFCVELPTHLPLSNRYFFFLKKPDLKFVCGSNILMQHFFPLIHLKQWMIGPGTFHAIKGAVFVGVGAQRRINNYNLITKGIYRYLFSNNFTNSVRDSYTEQLLKSAGINNVLNTACPTMWRFTKEFCKSIPTSKTKSVVFTLTDYNQNIDRDRKLLDIISRNYESVYFWPQGARDYKYFLSFSPSNRIRIIPPSLEAYDGYLKQNDTDFVGTRLHGGIRAMQHQRRTLILGIDNRATELQKDFNIPVISQQDINQLESCINSNMETMVNLPIDNIRLFLKQFGINYNS